MVTVCGKGSGRVSAAGLVCVRPGARGHLFYRVRVHRGRKGERRSMSEADYAGLIAAAHKELSGSPFSRSSAGQSHHEQPDERALGAMTSANAGYLPPAGPLRWRAQRNCMPRSS